MYLDCKCMFLESWSSLRFNSKLEQAMRDINYGYLQMLLMVIRLVLKMVKIEEFSY